jgi:hypothetical protein
MLENKMDTNGGFMNITTIKNLDSSFSHISWSAVFICAIAITAFSILFNILNMALGLSLENASDATGKLIVSSAIWVTVCAILTMFISGWATGYALPPNLRNMHFAGVVHGFLGWSLALLFTFFLSTLMAGQLFIGSSIYLAQNTYPQNILTYSTDKHDINVVPAVKDKNEAMENEDNVSNQKLTNTVTSIASYLVFAILTAGLVATCLGAYYGAKREPKFRSL